MTLDEDKAWVLWPEYFDITRTRDGGRKVSRKLSINSPNVELIAKAVKQMGLEFHQPQNAANIHYADLRIMPMWLWDPLQGRGFVLLRSA